MIQNKYIKYLLLCIPLLAILIASLYVSTLPSSEDINLTKEMNITVLKDEVSNPIETIPVNVSLDSTPVPETKLEKVEQKVTNCADREHWQDSLCSSPSSSNQVKSTVTQKEDIPEFPTVALPIASIIAMLFFMKRRK